jgi:hypothetical protein
VQKIKKAGQACLFCAAEFSKLTQPDSNYLEADAEASAFLAFFAFFAFFFGAEASAEAAGADAIAAAGADAEAAVAEAEAAKADRENRPATRAAISLVILMSFKLTC